MCTGMGASFCIEEKLAKLSGLLFDAYDHPATHLVAHWPATSIPEYGYRFKGAAPTRFWCCVNS